MEVIIILLLCYVIFYLPIKLVVKLVKYIDKKIYEKEQRKKLEITTNINVETECNNDCDVVNYDEVKENVVNNTENNVINNNINEAQEIVDVIETKVEEQPKEIVEEQKNEEIEIDENKIYWEDTDVLDYIEKLETKEHYSTNGYPFHKVFPDDVYYSLKKEENVEEYLEEIGFNHIRTLWLKRDGKQISEKCLSGNKMIGKYEVDVTYWFSIKKLRPTIALDKETKQPEPKFYYFEELEEKISEICSLANVTTNKDGLKCYHFGSGMSPEIKFTFKEYWNEPQTRKDFQKLGCTSIEYSDKCWTCYKQIGNKVLRLCLLKGCRHHYYISWIDEIDMKQDMVLTNNNEKIQVSSTKPSSVYLLFNPLNNTYKIGKANDVYKRLRTFQTGTPDIKLVTYKTYASEKQAYQMETMLHRQYQDNNYKKEWFNLNEEDVEFIKQTLS